MRSWKVYYRKWLESNDEVLNLRGRIRQLEERYDDMERLYEETAACSDIYEAQTKALNAKLKRVRAACARYRQHLEEYTNSKPQTMVNLQYSPTLEGN